jgi:hypothetical protein
MGSFLVYLAYSLFAPGWLPTDFYSTAYYYWSVLNYKVSLFSIICTTALLFEAIFLAIGPSNMAVAEVFAVVLIFVGFWELFFYDWESGVQQYIIVQSTVNNAQESSISRTSDTVDFLGGIFLGSAYAYLLYYQFRTIASKGLHHLQNDIRDSVPLQAVAEIPLGAHAPYQAVSMNI